MSSVNSSGCNSDVVRRDGRRRRNGRPREPPTHRRRIQIDDRLRVVDRPLAEAMAIVLTRTRQVSRFVTGICRPIMCTAGDGILMPSVRAVRRARTTCAAEIRAAQQDADQTKMKRITEHRAISQDYISLYPMSVLTARQFESDGAELRSCSVYCSAAAGFGPFPSGQSSQRRTKTSASSVCSCRRPRAGWTSKASLTRTPFTHA